MNAIRDGRVITWLAIIAAAAIAVTAVSSASANPDSTVVRISDSQAQDVITDLDYSIYQGVSAGANTQGVRTWVDQVAALAKYGHQLRSAEVANPKTDPLAVAFTTLITATQTGREALNDPQTNAASVRRSVVNAITYTTAVSQGKTVSPPDAASYKWSDAPLSPQQPTPPPSPSSPLWPFTNKETP